MKLSEQGLIVYKAMLDRSAFLREQQWTVTNQVVLVYGAILWFGSNVKSVSDTEKHFLIGLTIVACTYGVILLLLTQHNLTVVRRRIIDTNHKIFEQDEYAALGIPKFPGYLRGVWFRVAFITVLVLGAILLIFFLWQLPLKLDYDFSFIGSALLA
jgi:hypothetical protein